MSALAEIQLRFRDAVVGGDIGGIQSLLAGGREPEKRVRIHRRNYEAGLVRALLTKFPAVAWLAGTAFVTEAAGHFVRERTPHAPCIAEYGEDFPQFLAARPGAERMPYLAKFACLEWHLGHVAVAADRPGVPPEGFSEIDRDALPDVSLALQPGVRYMEAPWPIDSLMKLYLTETAPEKFVLDPQDVWLEVRGSRGAFDIKRLDAAEFIFRRSISLGQSIGSAAGQAMDAGSAFEPGQALAALIRAGLVAALS